MFANAVILFTSCRPPVLQCTVPICVMADVLAESADPAAHRCRNCGAHARGHFCANCGQETRLALPTFGAFMREAAGRYVALDGRFWRTLLGLVGGAGFLRLGYFYGRRRVHERSARE